MYFPPCGHLQIFNVNQKGPSPIWQAHPYGHLPIWHVHQYSKFTHIGGSPIWDQYVTFTHTGQSPILDVHINVEFTNIGRSLIWDIQYYGTFSHIGGSPKLTHMRHSSILEATQSCPGLFQKV